jgi:phage terminase small subunit
MTKRASLAENFARERGITKNPDGPLSARQERFCTTYFETGNAVEAYRSAYGTQAQRSTVGPKAYRLLAEPKVRNRVQELRDQAAEDAVVSVAAILQELKRVALFDPRSIVGDNGVLLPIDQMPSDAAAAIASIEVEERYEGEGPGRKWIGRTSKLRFWNKVDALDKAMKHLGLYRQDNRQKSAVSSALDSLPYETVRELERRLRELVEGRTSDESLPVPH